MLFQEGTANLMETVIDPLILTFFVIAATIFGISSYKKADLRLFAIAFLFMSGAMVFCILEIEIIEATLVITSSVISVIAAVILRIKTRKLEV